MMMLSRLQGWGRTQRLILNKVICNLEDPTANTQRGEESDTEDRPDWAAFRCFKAREVISVQIVIINYEVINLWCSCWVWPQLTCRSWWDVTQWPPTPSTLMMSCLCGSNFFSSDSTSSSPSCRRTIHTHTHKHTQRSFLMCLICASSSCLWPDVWLQHLEGCIKEGWRRVMRGAQVCPRRIKQVHDTVSIYELWQEVFILQIF